MQPPNGTRNPCHRIRLGLRGHGRRFAPLVGYLVAGFVLHALGYESTETIETVSEIGILLLLFGIGLKLKPATLARRQALAAGYLDQEWVSTVAVAVSGSFVVASAGNLVRYRWYDRWSRQLAAWE